MSITEHERLQDWLTRHDTPEFKQSVVSWNLSRVEARRAEEARIAELRASGRCIINDTPATG